MGIKPGGGNIEVPCLLYPAWCAHSMGEGSDKPQGHLFADADLQGTASPPSSERGPVQAQGSK